MTEKEVEELAKLIWRLHRQEYYTYQDLARYILKHYIPKKRKKVENGQ